MHTRTYTTYILAIHTRHCTMARPTQDHQNITHQGQWADRLWLIMVQWGLLIQMFDWHFEILNFEQGWGEILSKVLAYSCKPKKRKFANDRRCRLSLIGETTGIIQFVPKYNTPNFDIDTITQLVPKYNTPILT